MRKETQLNFYKTMAVPTLLNGSNDWKQNSSIQKVVHRKYVYTRPVRGELCVTPVLNQIHNYGNRWSEHL